MYKWQIFHRKKRGEMFLFGNHLSKLILMMLLIIALNEIENALLNKKYGLVWGRTSEHVDECYKSIFLFLLKIRHVKSRLDCPAIVQRLSSDCPAIVQQDYEKFNFQLKGIISIL